MMIDLMAAEERRKSPMPSQQEKIEDTNEKEKRQKGEEEEGKWLKHYSSVHQILLVGEGDFSFSLSLANAFGSASNIVTTSLECLDVVIKKYRNAKSNLENLVKLGATVLHGVDATKMKLHADLSMQEFDRIIFNFPHAGFYGREDQFHLLRLHMNLVHGFFKNASQMLCPAGEIHVSHKTGAPYDWWSLEELASNCSLTLIERVNFEKEDYPGYNNKRGHGSRCDEPFPLGECSTFKFQVNTQEGETSEAKAAYTYGQSFLNITESQVRAQVGNYLRHLEGGANVECLEDDVVLDSTYEIAEEFLQKQDHPKMIKRSQRIKKPHLKSLRSRTKQTLQPSHQACHFAKVQTVTASSPLGAQLKRILFLLEESLISNYFYICV